MQTTPKVIIGICGILCIIAITFIVQLRLDAFETYRTYEAKFQIVEYQRYLRTGGVSITLKNEDTHELIKAPVNDDCQYQPINKIITLTIHEKKKEFFGLFNMKFNTIINGPACMR